jgi:hypothetical protein
VLTDTLVHSTLGAATTSTLGPVFSFPMQPYMGSLGPSAAYGNYGALPYPQQSATPPQLGGSAAPSLLQFGRPYGGTLPFVFPPASSFDAAYPGGASTPTLAPLAPAATSSAQQFNDLLMVKLGQDNFLFWRAQFIPLLRSQGLQGFIDGSYPCPPDRVPVQTEGGRMALVPNPEHYAWVKQDQAIMSAIVGSLTPSVSGLILFATTAFDAWTTLNTSFGSQSSARAMQLCNKLGLMKKHDLTAHAYFNQVKMAADTLASIGQPLRDSEFTGFVLSGLDCEYDGLIEAVEGRDTPITERDL